MEFHREVPCIVKLNPYFCIAEISKFNRIDKK
jgi:hypothetical protein